MRDNEWAISKDSELGKIALRYRIFMYKTKKSVHMRSRHMERCLYLQKSREALPNPVINSRVARRLGI